MDGLEDIMLSEINQTNIVQFQLYVESKNRKQMNKHKKTETVTDTDNKQGFARRERSGERRETGEGD